MDNKPVYCAFCHVLIAPYDKKKIVDDLPYHEHHAPRQKVFKPTENSSHLQTNQYFN